MASFEIALLKFHTPVDMTIIYYCGTICYLYRSVPFESYATLY